MIQGVGVIWGTSFREVALETSEVVRGAPATVGEGVVRQG